MSYKMTVDFFLIWYLNVSYRTPPIDSPSLTFRHNWEFETGEDSPEGYSYDTSSFHRPSERSSDTPA